MGGRTLGVSDTPPAPASVGSVGPAAATATSTAHGAPSTAGGWGILGGTFDPVHFAHLAIAEQAREALDLAGVLFVPARMPPHKPDRVVTPAADRVAMVELAIAGNPGFRLSRVEVDREGPSYSVETVRRLLDDPPQPWLPEPGLLFILSVEALVALHSWHDPDRLLELCRLAVVPRRGYPVLDRSWTGREFPGREERILFLDGPDLGHSASDIRARVAAGRSIRYLVPTAVEAYIREHVLYRSTEGRIDRT